MFIVHLIKSLKSVTSRNQSEPSLLVVCLLDKTSTLHVVVRLFSNWSQKTSKCGNNIYQHLSTSIASFATFSFLPHFDVTCDQLLNRRTKAWNLFVKLVTVIAIGPRSWNSDDILQERMILQNDFTLHEHLLMILINLHDLFVLIFCFDNLHA